MSFVMIACPSTGQLVSTGIEVDASTFAELSLTEPPLFCPSCGNEHSWAVAWLGDVPVRTPPKVRSDAA
jgi:hypothetical protein